MGQISSSVGLISGINTADIIDQLISIDARPKQLVEQRNVVLTSQQVAFQDINAKLLISKLSVSAFSRERLFDTTTASSSDESTLSVASSSSTVPGTYELTVDRLVTTQQIITSGFTDQDTKPVAFQGGSLTFEFGDARLNSDTELAQLNGGTGINRGVIQITDRSGNSATVDLSKALTVNDVLDAINATSSINVIASIEGNGFKLDDTSGGSGTLSVSDIGNSNTTASLGLNTTPIGDTLTGSQVNSIGIQTSLNALNDGNGVGIRVGVDDFQIKQRDGTTFNVNLEGASTIGDVINTINTASGGNVTASVNPAGTGLQLVDTSVSDGTILEVTALNSSTAATDLGILTTDADDDGTLDGTRIIASLNSRLIGNLNGGSGITSLGTIDVTNRSGVLTTIDLSSAESVDDIISLINDANAGINASINSVGTGILLSDTTGNTVSNLIIADNTGTAATDLGIATSVSANTINSGNLQLRYISQATRLDSLNGGRGITRGRFTITDSAGASATVDLTQGDEVTIRDVLSEINSRGLAVNARINDNGDGILIEDQGPGTTKIKIDEAGSTTARELGILGEAENAGDNIDGSFEKNITIGSVQTLLGTTSLNTLNGGDGVDTATGQDDLTIITRDSSTYQIDFDNVNTIDDVISLINTTHRRSPSRPQSTPLGRA